jgi:hypothetical protein
LTYHEEGVSEVDSVEIEGIRVDPVRFVNEREEVEVPLCRERHEFSEGCVWCVEVPDTGEKVVEDGDKGSTTVLEESLGRMFRFCFKSRLRVFGLERIERDWDI